MIAMRGAPSAMTFPPPGPERERPHARHAADLPRRDVGRAEPVAPWLPPHQPAPQPRRLEPSRAPESGRAPDLHPEPSPPPAGAEYGDEPTYRHAEAPVAPPVSPWDEALPDLRNKVVNRLTSMNWNQAVATWRRRRHDPLNPHVLVFFFAEPPTGRPARCELQVAARLFPAGDEQRLAMLLYELLPVVHDHLRAGRDPDQYLFSWHDPRSPHARYAGLGVTSLDTPAGSWEQVQKTAQSDMDVPGRCYAYLVDGSALLIDRLARQQFGEYRILTSHPVTDVSGGRYRPTHLARDLAVSDTYGPDNRAIWRWLSELNRLMAGGGNRGA